MTRYMTMTVVLGLEVGLIRATVEVVADAHDGEIELRTLHKLANDAGGTWDYDSLCKAEAEARGFDFDSYDLVDEILEAVEHELMVRDLATADSEVA